ncbi:type II toxin-antitoxin system VapC family toxin [Neorhizobium sp. JUb45]|uniref:type II toxin-antitoxin system VapC family toxin n=1 Tax=unclassified Neorhizobium TaxID=2629175 RepID=UPI001046A7D6|nr:type II toxin-antitoxin system VapC family toxin [Neorhizobium sp. JUb45]TCR01261.1 ribonuclease VapC [Neorhizobium sp. JUb45]
MFVDASAIVAIISDEDGAAVLLEKINAAQSPIHYSSLVIFEAVIGLTRKKKASLYGENSPMPAGMIEEMQKLVGDFLDQINATEIDLPAGLHETALDAAKTFGRFVGHPAKLNFGDCFTYAAAKTFKSPLLFVGEDFAQTDIEVA